MDKVEKYFRLHRLECEGQVTVPGCSKVYWKGSRSPGILDEGSVNVLISSDVIEKFFIFKESDEKEA